ncbi:MAG: tripartite tricarboxylate transporter substrate-binding protein [Chloroflexi bacterium]|nr:tripartite tricarboxylate transporter substrate-binding protein [Chloroflexota bacterium]
MWDRILKLTSLVVAIVLATSAISVLALACSQVNAPSTPEQFYRGKTLNWVVASVPGSSTDLLARAIAPHLAKELGATVKVTNMGTDEGVNYVYAEAKRDGLTMVINAANAVLANDILKAPGVRYETEKFNFIADVNPGGQVFQISPKTPYRTLDLLRLAKGLKGGGTSAKGSLATSAAVMSEVLRLDARVVTGYGGKKELTLSLARGEVDFMVTSEATGQKDEADGYVVNLFTLGQERSKTLPRVPSMAELGVKVPPELESAVKLISDQGHASALPPDVPQERVEHLRKVFLKLSDDKDLQKELEKLSGVFSPFKPGREQQESIAAIKANKELASQIDAIFAKHKATQ